MHPTTALLILQHLARNEVLTTKMTSFMVEPYPQLAHPRDVKEAFASMREQAGHPERDMRVTATSGVLVWTSERLFEKLFRAIFLREGIFPKSRSSRHGKPGDSPLPTLFVSGEKTQVRQIPLAERPPWPFKHLLELGGMVVVKTQDPRSMLESLRTFLNNHPQFEIKVRAEECPDGSVSIFTYWFRELPRSQRKGNLNVPSR